MAIRVRKIEADPAALPPVLIVAGSDAAFARWLPLRVEGEDDCLAPLALK